MRPIRAAVVAVVIAASLLAVGFPAIGQDESSGPTPGLAEAREAAEAAALAFAEAEGALHEAEDALAAAEAELVEVEARVAELEQRVRDLAVRRYVGAGDASVFDSDDATEMQARETVMGVIADTETELLDAFAAERARAVELRATRAEAVRQLESDVAAAAEAREQLDAELARLEDIERERLAEEKRKAEEAARLAAEEAARTKALEDLAVLVRLESARAAAPAAPSAPDDDDDDTPTPSTPVTPPVDPPSEPIATGEWVCPVQGPHTFIDSWGFPRSGGRRHKGVDMMAKSGTPVVAPVSGTVEHRGNSLGGLSFHLEGDDGTYYYGTHLSAYANVGAGWVAAGTLVGYVGDTGNAKGNPHLHFEIHPGGQGNAVNPYPTVKKYC